MKRDTESGKFLRNISAKSYWVMKENVHQWDFPQVLSVIKNPPRDTHSPFLLFFWDELPSTLRRRERRRSNRKILLEKSIHVNAIKMLIFKTPTCIWTAWEGQPTVALDSPAQCIEQLLVLPSQARFSIKWIHIIVSSHPATQKD